MPGHGGGGWLQRDWGLEDGSGTRVSVQSPVYVGLTASVSKAAKGKINDDIPRGTAGEKDFNEEAEDERGNGEWCSRAQSPSQVQVYECPKHTITHTPFNPQCQESLSAHERSAVLAIE